MKLNIKKTSMVALFLCVCFVVQAEEGLLSRVFFNDFVYVPKIISENPLQSCVVLGTTALVTAVLMPNDKAILKALQKNTTPAYKTFFDVFNTFGDGVYVLSADAVLFLVGGEKEKRVASKILESIAVGGAVTYVGKSIVGRVRPSQTDNAYKYNMFTFKDASMSSGHSMVAFAWATIIADEYGLWYVTYPIAVLTGVARVYKNAHWPSDVLVGAVIGTFFAKVAEYENKDMQLSYNINGFALNYKF